MNKPRTKPVFFDGQWISNELAEQTDREKTGRIRCIGCGKFVSKKRRWNQCADCDTREPESY